MSETPLWGSWDGADEETCLAVSVEGTGEKGPQSQCRNDARMSRQARCLSNCSSQLSRFSLIFM